MSNNCLKKSMKPWICRINTIATCEEEIKNINETFERHGIRVSHAEYLIDAKRELSDRAMELGAQPEALKQFW